MSKQRTRLGVERLEDRTLAAATASVALVGGVLSVQADDAGDFFVVSQKSVAGVAQVELFRADNGGSLADFNANQVASILFTGGKGGDTFYNNTSLPSTQKANNAAGKTTVLNGGSTSDVLDGSAAQGAVYENLTANGTEVGGAGLSNLFALGGTHSIVAGTGFTALYSIVGADAIDLTRATSGYALVSAKATVVGNPGVQQVTFFQPVFATTTSPVLLQTDAQGRGVLYLLPQVQTSVSYVVNQLGSLIQVNYLDANGAKSLAFPKASVQWLAFFGGPGGNQLTNNTTVNDVFYGGKGSDVLIGGFGINVLKGHAGQDIVLARGSTLNDISVGPGGSSTLIGGGGNNVFRNDAAKIDTTDFNVHRGDVVVGVPSYINGDFSPDQGQAALNPDYLRFYQDLQRPIF